MKSRADSPLFECAAGFVLEVWCVLGNWFVRRERSVGLLSGVLALAWGCRSWQPRPPAPPPPSQIPGNPPPTSTAPWDAGNQEQAAGEQSPESSAGPLPLFPEKAFFGDLHVHSSWSVDAGLAGATFDPDEVYRFARGEELELPSGGTVQLDRPLDFVLVADHAENLGLIDYLERSDFRLLGNPTGRRWHELFQAGRSYDVFTEWSQAKKDPLDEPKLLRDAWSRAVSAAERFYQPGRLTTFSGFEWTSEPKGDCLHRTVLLRGGPRQAKELLPLSRFDTIQPEELWRYLEQYERKTKSRALAIPHNGNFSNGLMFDELTSDGRTMQPDDVNRRRHFEPLFEVTQMKGDAETHPELSPRDEFADFERIDVGNLGASAAKTSQMLSGEYARPALLRGLRLEKARAQNPFQFGLVGGTDTHTGLSTVDEHEFLGVASMTQPSKHRLERVYSRGDRDESSVFVRELSASGLTGVWARANSREEIFDALTRREVFATTGPRIGLRVFAGYAFERQDLEGSEFARRGYAKGVPMGGELHAAPFGRGLRLLVSASKDPAGVNLDRVQVIKGYLDKAGQTHERIFDVAVSDGRRIDASGRCRTPIELVDGATDGRKGLMGAPSLEALFEDPTFDPKQLAFYYVRVLEVPKPRWTTHDSETFGVDVPKGTPLTLQDRAYSSPIWYLPTP